MVDFSDNKFTLGKATNKFGDDFIEEDIISAKPINIYTQQLTVRKKATVVMGIPDDIDYALVLKAWKKLFHCVGSIREDTKKKTNYIVLNGDHREEVRDFLIHEGIGTKENIKMHGADM
jgi:translation initiation factor 1